MHGFAAGEGDAGRPHRVVRHGDEDFIPVIDKGVHGKLDELAGAVARIDIRHGDVGDVLDLRILHDGLAGRLEAAGLGIAFGIDDGGAYIRDDFIGGPEAIERGVADVELEDVEAGLFHAVGFFHHGAADIVENVIQFG